MKLIINTDGGCVKNTATAGDASCAFVARSETGAYIASLNEMLIGSNNVAEYRGAILAAVNLDILLNSQDYSFDSVEFRLDSMLVVKQYNGEWHTQDNNMWNLLQDLRKALKLTILPVRFRWVPREENKEADYLCNLALDGKIITNMFAPMLVKESIKTPTAGQLFRIGQLKTPRPLRVDANGFAICNGCRTCITQCVCPDIVAA